MKRSKLGFWLFLAPCLITFLTVVLIPMICGFYYSFTDWDGMSSSVNFVGLDNFIRLFTKEEQFWVSFGFTALFTLVSLVLINMVGFALALLVTKKFKGANILRSVFFMPNLIGGIVLGYIWQLIINGVLYKYEVTLTYSPTYGFWGLVILMNWQMIGYMMVIYIAGIQNIPKDVMEAAKIDGAKPFQILKRVTIPLVMPSFTICLFLTMSNSFKLFDQNLALTAGAPSKKTAMMALDIYNTFYGSVGSEGIGQAKAVLFFIIVALVAFIQLRITRDKEVEN